MEELRIVDFRNLAAEVDQIGRWEEVPGHTPPGSFRRAMGSDQGRPEQGKMMPQAETKVANLLQMPQEDHQTMEEGHHPIVMRVVQ